MDTVRDFLISRGANKNIALESAVYNRDLSSTQYFLGKGAIFDSSALVRYCSWIQHQHCLTTTDEMILGMLLGSRALPWNENDRPEFSGLYVNIRLKCTDRTLCDCAFVALNRLRRDAGLPELEYKELSTCIIA